MGPSEPANLAEVWRKGVAQYPTAAAVASGDVELTYAEASERVDRLAANLADKSGVGPGAS